MNRRNFLQLGLGALGLALLPKVVASEPKVLFYDTETNRYSATTRLPTHSNKAAYRHRVNAQFQMYGFKEGSWL